MAPVALTRERGAGSRPQAGRDHAQASGHQLVAHGQQIARGLAQRRLEDHQRAAGREQCLAPGTDALGARGDTLHRRHGQEQLVQKVRGDDEIEPTGHTAHRPGRGDVGDVDPRRPDPIDRDDLRSGEERAHGGPCRARARAQVEHAHGRRLRFAKDLTQHLGQRDLGARRDLGSVLLPQLRVTQVGLPDKRPLAHQPFVHRPAASREPFHPLAKMSLKLTMMSTPSSKTKPTV